MINTRTLKSAMVAIAAACLLTQSAFAQTTEKEVVVIDTEHGEMVLELWEDVAPETVKNFKKLIKEEFYDGTAFHRIIDGFMIQGGDPLTKDETKSAQWGTGGPGYMIDAEFNEKKHVRGVISMARSSDPDSAGSQFFICLGDAKFLDGKYTAFGKLVAGDDVLEKFGKTECVQDGRENSRPKERAGVKTIKLEKRTFEDNDK